MVKYPRWLERANKSGRVVEENAGLSVVDEDDADREIRERTQQPAKSGKRTWQRVGAVAGCIVGCFIFGFLGFNAYLQAAEWLEPSGKVAIVIDGEKIYLEQPRVLATPNPSPSLAVAKTPSTSSAADNIAAPATSTPTLDPASDSAEASVDEASPETPLPPVELRISNIDIDFPVVVASNANLPKQPLVGWYFGSALPGTAGNSVLLGHVDGRGATFGRLHEMQPGDEISVLTTSYDHIYVVDWIEEVNPGDVSVIGPSSDAVLTLITCTGNWIPAERQYDKRLVVRAHYAARIDLSRTE